MNLYGLNYSLFDLGVIDDPAFMDYRSRGHMDMEEENLLKLSNSILKNVERTQTPPKHRHDGSSPLPLGMDWSPPPRNWNGPNTIWPHDYHTGWSYCVTIPSWSIFSEMGSSEPVAFYSVQVGVQSPEGITTTRSVQRRFSDFLKLSTDLKRSFRKKRLPPAPPKGLLRTHSRAHLEERRRSLEDWMAKVLLDMDFSRSASVACFLELEAAARSSFNESSHHVPRTNSSCNSGSSSDLLSSHSNVSVAASSSVLPNYNNGSTCETTEIGKYSEFYKDDVLAPLTETTDNKAFYGNNTGASNNASQHHNVENSRLRTEPMVSPIKDLPREGPRSCTGSATPSETSNQCEVHPERSTSSKFPQNNEASGIQDTFTSTDLQFLHNAIAVIPTNEQKKVKRLFDNMQRVVTSKTDMENLLSRVDQEHAEKQHLRTKVKDLETELELAKKSCKEDLERSILIERERNTQMQWDMEELKRSHMEMQLKLKAGQDEIAQSETTKKLMIQESQALREELDSAREQLQSLQKCHEESELKSKSDIKLLAKEVKTLLSSRSESRKELDRLEKEKTELERILREEKQQKEHIDAATFKLLHECKILRKRLEECSVNFLVEEENKLKLDTDDALDVLTTSEHRIGVVLAEAQLLARDIGIPLSAANIKCDYMMTMDTELRKMLIDVFIDNAMLSKRINSIMSYALSMPLGTVQYDDSSRKTDFD